MKIIGLKFKNINSLKGSHAIRFDQAPFNQYNLFSITGDTGSGKTTVLDAISLALYGRVARHDQHKSYECVTRHTNDAFTEVEFEIRGVKYRASWAISLGKSGKTKTLPSPKMELAISETGEIIANQRVQEVKDEIVSLTGLDYSQFQRSVMLSQGEFALFLKSKEKERSELLEKITDTAIYSDISKLVFDKNKQAKQALEQLKQNLKDIQLLNPEELVGLNLQLSQLEELQNHQSETLKLEQTILAWLNKIKDLKAKLVDGESRLMAINQKATSHQSDFDLLALHQKAYKYAGLIERYLLHTGEFKKNESTYSQLRTELQDLQEKLEDQDQQWQTAQRQHQQTSRYLLDLQPIIDQVRQLDTILVERHKQAALIAHKHQEMMALYETFALQIKNKESELHQAKNELTQVNHWFTQFPNEDQLEITLPSLKLQTTQLSEWKQRITVYLLSLGKEQANKSKLMATDAENKQKHLTIRSQLDKITAHQEAVQQQSEQLLAGSSLEALENEAEQLGLLLTCCTTQASLAREYIKQSSLQLKLQTQLKSVQAQLESVQNTIELIDPELAHAQETLTLLEEQARLLSLVTRYETERWQLISGQACPVCGSEDHPYTKLDKCLVENVSPTTPVAIDPQKHLVNDLQQQKQQLAINLETLKTTQQHYNTQLSQIQVDIDLCIADFTNNNQQLPSALAIDNLDLIERVVLSKKRTQDQIKETIKSLRALQSSSTIDQQQQQACQSNLNANLADSELLKQQIINVDNSIQVIESQLTDAQKAVDQLVVIIENQLQQFGQTANLDSVNTIQISIDQLYQRVGVYKVTQTELVHCQQLFDSLSLIVRNLSEQQVARLSEMQLVENELKQQNQQIADLQNRRTTLFEQKDPNEELQKVQQQLTVSSEQFQQSEQQKNTLRNQIEVISQQVATAELQLETIHATLQEIVEDNIEAVREDGFENFETIQQRLLPVLQVDKIMEIKQDIEDQRSKCYHSLLDLQEELLIETQQHLSAQDQDFHRQQITAIEQELQNHRETSGRLKERKEQHDRNEQKWAEQKELELHLEKEALVWEQLSQLIGSADGNKFRSFAQSLSLDLLKTLANVHLHRLTPRYEIHKTPTKDLELQIIDRYQANSIRPMNTLSGGETFLVSLALALGLSEMASRKNQINSLFIDEGFGSLDKDTLDIAISALESLQVEGKTIGIISHIPELKERIPAEIHLEKGLGGYSTISIKQ